MKNILLTFDYEPFLGLRSGSLEKCMIEPTHALYTILKRYPVKTVFFIDVLYLKELGKRSEMKSAYQLAVKQLKELFDAGHYIFPHIHPHWMDAEFIQETHEFSLSNLNHYAIGKLDQTQITSLFDDAINFLKDLGISYKKWGYRAGGWCIQPFEMFKEVFIKESIFYEFSVLPGYRNDHILQHFDFSKVETNVPYRFEDKVEEIEPKGQFIEFPISTISFNKWDYYKDRLLRKYLWETNDRGWGNGLSAQTSALQSVFKNQEMISIDILNRVKLSNYKKYLRNENYMHWISHPKMFTRHGLVMFDKFLEYVNEHFEINYDFEKMIPANNA